LSRMRTICALCPRSVLISAVSRALIRSISTGPLPTYTAVRGTKRGSRGITRAAQVMLRWHLQQGRQAIPKSVTPHGSPRTSPCSTSSSTIDELAPIDALDTGVRVVRAGADRQRSVRPRDGSLREADMKIDRRSHVHWHGAATTTRSNPSPTKTATPDDVLPDMTSSDSPPSTRSATDPRPRSGVARR
jgi:hypothetical protein